MTENPFVNDPDQVIHKTLFLSDFTTLDTNRVENVTIEVSGYTGAPATRTVASRRSG